MKESKFTKALSGLLCATMIFSSVSQTVVSYAYAAEPTISSGVAEQEQLESEQLPMEEVQPAEGEQQPIEGEQQPAEGEQQPAENEQQPTEGEQLVEGEQPVEGEQAAEGEQAMEMQLIEEAQPVAEEQLTEEEQLLLAEAEQNEYLYLSELTAIESQVGHGSLKNDASESGDQIHLIVDGERTVFRRGIGAHATSTVIYDISNYSDTLTHFIAYLGVDARMNGGGNGVKFTISVSDDKQTWKDLYQSGVVTGSQNAVYVDLDVTGKKFLKLYADNNGHPGQDHSVYADARLKTESYDPDVENKAPFFRLKKYDELLARNTPEYNLANHLDLIYEREFVKRIGFNTLQNLCEDPRHKEAIEFLKNNETAMHYFIDGGPLNPDAHSVPEKSMIAFSKIYAEHKDQLTSGAENDFYLRLAISVASVYSYPENVRFWLEPNLEENPLKRYESFVKLSEPGGAMDDAGSSGGNSKWSAKEFRALPVPLMRWVVDTRMNEDELFWLADYALANRVREPDKDFLDAYTYIDYLKYDYSKPEYYDPNNHKKWNDIYGFDDYFQYGGDTRRLWIVFEEGSVCGGLAKTYANLAEVFGRPSVVVGQPGHAATVTWEYDQNSGKHLWKIQNNISGWAESHSEYSNYLLGWGTSQYAKGEPAPYTVMATDAINDYENYIRANHRVMLANSYTDSDTKIDLYEKALQIQKFNVDAWEGLVTLKLKDESMSSKDYLDLAKRIMDELKYYPRAMEDLLRAIKGKITEPQDIAQFDLLRLTTLREAERATSKESSQPNVCVDLAKFLQNKDTTHLASFSFTGANAGAIVLNEKYDHSRIQVRYSLDGGQKWTETSEHIIQLTDEQLDGLTAEHDILVGLIGSNVNYTIDIQTQKRPEQGTVYLNDQENLVFPENEYLEYSVDGGNTWKDYDLTLQSEERFTGNQSVQLRFKRNGTYLASDVNTYTFKEDTNTPERTYLQLKHVTLKSFSSEQGDKDRYATHLIDGNGNTIWHSKYDIIDKKEYVVEFDQPYHLSEVEYLPYTANGRWKTVQIFTSMDGEHWTLAGEASLADNDRLKTIPLDSTQPARYLKVQGLDSWGSPADKYFSGKMLNFYVDTTKNPVAPATVTYSTTDKTNQNVVATITLPEGCQMLEGETTYTFEQNGTHTFRYEDAYKNTYEVTAEVTWIRKADLTGTITYSTTDPTRDNVVAEIGGFAFDDVYVKNNNQSPTYTFTANGEFVFELADSYGNTGMVKAVVQNIDRTAPKAHIAYSSTDWTGDDVTVTLQAEDGETYTILNNEGKDTYTFTKNGTFTFEIQDAAKNTSKVIATVDWIDKSKDQIKAEYDQQGDSVTVTLTIDPEAHEIVNNDGQNTYTFHENGTFVFQIRLKDGGKVVSYEVTVDSISAKPDEPVNPQPPVNPDTPNTPDGQTPSHPTDPQNPQDGAKPDTGKNPATGDEMNLLFPVLGMVGSTAVLFVLLRRRKQHGA